MSRFRLCSCDLRRKIERCRSESTVGRAGLFTCLGLVLLCWCEVLSRRSFRSTVRICGRDRAAPHVCLRSLFKCRLTSLLR